MKAKGRRNFLVSSALAVAGLSICRAEAEIPQQCVSTESVARATALIRDLELKILPKESGYIGIIGRSTLQVQTDGRQLAAQSQNYYMLTRDRPINYLHWLACDDTHILIEGGPVDYFIFHPEGRAERRTLGMSLSKGQKPVVAVPAGCWKALQLRPESGYALMANVLSPEFTTDRVRIGERAPWIRGFEGKAPWATAEFLREMIGPNWRD